MIAQKPLHRMRANLIIRRATLLWCFGATFGWGLLAHAYGFLHTSLSHDVLNAFVATPAEETWKIELGRYFVPVYRAVFRGGVTIPWVIGLLGLMWTAFAVYLVVRLFDVESHPLMVLIAGIMVTNITYISQIATYVYEFDFNALAMMLSVAAVYLWKKGGSLLCILAGFLCLLVSECIYQAYFDLTIALVIFCVLFDLFKGADIKRTFLHGQKATLMIFSGAAGFLVTGRIVTALTGITKQGRVDVLDTGEQSMGALYASLVKPALFYLKDAILHKAYNSGVLKFLLLAALILLFVLGVTVLIRRRFSLGRMAVMALHLVSLPFGTIAIFFLAKGSNVHDLMIYSVWFFYIFLLLLAWYLCEQEDVPAVLARVARALCCIVVASLLWQNVLLANTAYVKKEAEATATLSTMTRAVSMMEREEDYVPGETPVAFVGTIRHQAQLPLMDKVETITGLAFRASIPQDTSVYYYNAYKTYFAYVLNYPVNLCSDETHARLKADPRVQTMPAFPADGCIETIDGVMVVKMG